MSTAYDRAFFEGHKDASTSSAEEILPIVLPMASPRSVVDVGCGIGTWLSVAARLGVSELLGIDGEYVDTGMLMIGPHLFRKHDLRLPLILEHKYDLVLSLEVAEHLPAFFADTFVESLCRSGDIILFSAAIPYQIGTNHINLQWQDYWANKFEERGFVPLDCIRPVVWDSEKVAYWYAQNTILYVHRDKIGSLSLQGRYGAPARSPLNMVHPKCYLENMYWRDLANTPVSALIRQVLRATRRAALHRLTPYSRRFGSD